MLIWVNMSICGYNCFYTHPIYIKSMTSCEFLKCTLIFVLYNMMLIKNILFKNRKSPVKFVWMCTLKYLTITTWYHLLFWHLRDRRNLVSLHTCKLLLTKIPCLRFFRKTCTNVLKYNTTLKHTPDSAVKMHMDMFNIKTCFHSRPCWSFPPTPVSKGQPYLGLHWTCASYLNINNPERFAPLCTILTITTTQAAW